MDNIRTYKLGFISKQEAKGDKSLYMEVSLNQEADNGANCGLWAYSNNDTNDDRGYGLAWT